MSIRQHFELIQFRFVPRLEQTHLIRNQFGFVYNKIVEFNLSDKILL